MARAAAVNNPSLDRFLQRYDEPDCFYDWGDDPSFFSATESLGDVRQASWGVCRRDVRARLISGDYIVFFCARAISAGLWHYFYIGVATLDRDVDHRTIWEDDRYKPYRTFFNVLARPGHAGLEHFETFSLHDDWLRRAEAPYWLFDPVQSRFNLNTPAYVASFDRTRNAIEQWRDERDSVGETVYALLFPASGRRLGLRATNLQISHPPINLSRQLPTTDLGELRLKLIDLVG